MRIFFAYFLLLSPLAFGQSFWGFNAGLLDNRTPSQVSGLKLWLRTDTLGLTNDAPIAIWPDSSGNGNNATEATNKPLFKTNAFGYLPGIKFDGVNDKLVTTSFLNSSFNTNITVFAVTRPGSPATVLVWGSHNGNTFYLGRTFDVRYNTSNLTDTQISAIVGNPTTGTIIETFRYDGAVKVIRTNSVQATSESATGNIGFSGALTLGGLSSGSQWWPGYMAEVLIYNRALSNAECTVVERYLKRKWIDQLNLVVFDGDSLTFGLGALTGQSYPEQSLTGLNAALSYNFGVLSQTTTNALSDISSQTISLFSSRRPKNIYVLWIGSSDLYFGGSATNCYKGITNLCTQVRQAGFKVTVATIITRTNAGTPGGFETERTTLNSAIVANWTAWADGLVNLAADPRLQNSTNTTYFSADKVHLNTTGYSVVQELTVPVVAGL